MRHGNVRIAQRSPWSFVAAPLFADGRNLDRTDEPSAKPDRRTQSNGVITVDSDRSLHHGLVSGDQMLGNVGDGTRKVPTFFDQRSGRYRRSITARREAANSSARMYFASHDRLGATNA
jgi:hypothetical protein